MFHRPLISLTTDFGYEDPFVGVMKGVIYHINPHVNIVDLTHSICPQDIKQAAFTVGMNYQYFPRYSIHLVVVDPEVGSSRRPLLVVADEHYFIGPDNGVFSYLYTLAPADLQVIDITSEHLFLAKKSPTFQGRDVFSPCAAWLSRGLDIGKFGEAISDYRTIHLPTPVRQNNHCLQGEVLFIDRFGNAITNISKDEIDALYGTQSEGTMRILCKDNEITFRDFYAQAEDRTISALINSSGYLEIFMFRENASSKIDIAPGDIVTIDFSS